MAATFLVASLHALWHLPAYFVNGAIISGGFDLNVFVGNSLAIIGLSVVWTWLFNKAGESILFATFVHATSNAMSGALPAALNLGAPNPWVGFAVAGSLAMIVLLLTRGRLGYSAPASAAPDK